MIKSTKMAGPNQRQHNTRYRWRECMRCREPFRSQGNHNRMCSDCKEGKTRADALHVEYETAR